MTTMTTDRRATDKQTAFLSTLLGEKDLTGTAFPAWTQDVCQELTTREASAAIDALLKLPRARRTPDGGGGQEVSEGMWLVGASVATGRVFKVQAARGSGNLYAKELVDGSFQYVAGAARTLARQGRKLTLEEAKAYGALYGTCCVCGRTLSDEDSIAAGIGPVCATRF